MEKKQDFKSSKVLVVGVGGLGTSCIYTLAQAGITNIGIVDKDVLELSNLNRQVIYNPDDIGKSKVLLAAKYIKNVFPDIKIKSYDLELNKKNIKKIIEEYDIVIDCSDNFTAKFLLNDACYFYKKILITASVIQFHGQILSIMPGKTTCLRCIFYNPPSEGIIPTCQEAGILGPLAGMFGILEAMEAIRYISQKKMLYINRLFTYNCLEIKGRKIPLKRNIDCPLCGKKPKIFGIQ